MSVCGCEKWRAAGWLVWCASCRRGDPSGWIVSGAAETETPTAEATS